MTLWVVADSGTLLATAFNETVTPQAIALWKSWDDAGAQVAVPVLFKYELVAAVRKNVYRQIIQPGTAADVLAALLTREVHPMLDDALLRRAYELATLFNRPTAYDAQYLALAERLNCEFWTTDQRLVNAVSGSLAWVKWCGTFNPA